MTKHQIILFSKRIDKKNLNTLCVLYKQSKNILKFKYKPLDSIFNILVTKCLDHDLLNDKILHYNRSITYFKTTTENIRDSIVIRLALNEGGLSYMQYLFKRM